MKEDDMLFRRNRRPYNKYGNLVKGRYVHRTCSSDGPCVDRSPILDSGYSLSQTWKGLRKAWLGYVISLDKGEDARRRYYASIVQKLQYELVDNGFVSQLSMADFPDLGLFAFEFENKYQKQLEEDLIAYKPLEQIEWERSFTERPT